LQTDRIDSYEERVFRTMDDLRPDLILLAGDYLQVPTARQFQEQQPRLRALLNGMRHQPRLGILAVTGDVDYCGDAAMALSGTNVRCLNDEAVELGHGSRLQVIGLTLASSRRPPAPETWQQIRGFEGFTILLGHAPDYARTLIRDGCDLPLLCVAGHTHGGQVVVPGFGPVLTLSRVPRKYASGFHQIGNGWLLVSRGVGHECGPAPRIRLCCRPELVVVDLQPADPQPADPQPGNMRER
ncbi:MAG: metallophosphoesterase, partial [Planctomycetota bacterium]